MDTCNGEIEATDEADIFVHDLEMPTTALVVPSTSPPLISVGLLAKDSNVTFIWKAQGDAQLIKEDGTVVHCQRGVNVPIIAAA